MKSSRPLLAAVLTSAALGVLAPSALAGSVQVAKDASGATRLVFAETDRTAGEANAITVAATADRIEVTDATTTLTPKGGCTASGPSTISCPAAGVSLLVFPLGLLNDTFDNHTNIAARVLTGQGSDRIIDSGGGDDTLEMAGNERDEVLSCGAGKDTVHADRRDTVAPGSGCETVNGVSADPGTVPTGDGTPAPAPPASLPINPAPAGTQVPTNAESVTPTAKPGACRVLFLGTAGADRVDGTNDGDLEFGLGGNDYLDGQAGDDCLYGGDGADRLLGDDGLDLLAGGSGADRAYGGNGNDRAYGNSGNDILNGNNGTDRLSGAAGNDRLYGGAGSDKLYGSTGKDRLSGAAGNDLLSGGSGADQLFGGAGADRILGGPGGDVVSGGPGNDHISAHDHARDRITCGPGSDHVVADRVDVLHGCEHVTYR